MVTHITPSKADVAAEVHGQVLRLRQHINALKLPLGLALVRIEDEKLYHALGFESFSAYLEQPELGISERSAYRYMAVARAFLEEPAASANGGSDALPSGDEPDDAEPVLRSKVLSIETLAELGPSKAAILAPVLTAPETTVEQVDEWVAKARAVSVPSLAREVREARHGPADARFERLEYLSSLVIRKARHAPYAADPAAIWDEIAAISMEAVAEFRPVVEATAHRLD